MRIAEMEAHHEMLMGLENKVQTMLSNRDFPAVFPVCEETFPHIVPAIQFRKKREIEPAMPELLSFAAIVKYAPVLFEHGILESFLTFLSDTRQLARRENNYLAIARSALEFEEIARCIWNKLERDPGCSSQAIQDELNIGNSIIDSIMEIWEELGVICRAELGQSQVLYLQSPSASQAKGICHTCGAKREGFTELFYQPITCTECRTADYFCILKVSH